MSGVFPAKFDGTCAAGCDSRIHPGDAVRFESDRLIHADCVAKPTPFELLPSEVVCGTCWVLQPCRCTE